MVAFVSVCVSIFVGQYFRANVSFPLNVTLVTGLDLATTVSGN